MSGEIRNRINGVQGAQSDRQRVEDRLSMLSVRVRSIHRRPDGLSNAERSLLADERMKSNFQRMIHRYVIARVETKKQGWKLR